MRRTLTTTSLFLIGGMTIALAQTSPLPGPQPSAKTEAGQPTSDPDLAKFRSAYTSGDGIAYVVINDEKGERIYRYGDASRLTAKKDTRGYMLFTCASPHVFVPQKPEDKTALMKADVVKAGELRFKLPQSIGEIRAAEGQAIVTSLPQPLKGNHNGRCSSLASRRPPLDHHPALPHLLR